MNRKEFLSQVGFGVAAVIVPACIGGLAGCKKEKTAPSNVDFTEDTSTGPLATNGGFIVRNETIVARTNSGTFIAVAAACTHQGTIINYNSGGNNFICPNHQSNFDSSGNVIFE